MCRFIHKEGSVIHIITKVIQLENGVVEYHTDKAIVRIHPGKRTEEERKVAIINASEKFLKAALQQYKKSEKNRTEKDGSHVCRNGGSNVRGADHDGHGLG